MSKIPMPNTNINSHTTRFKSFFKSTTMQSLIGMFILNVGVPGLVFLSQGGNADIPIPPGVATLANFALIIYGGNGRLKANPNLALNPKKAEKKAEKAQAQA